MSTETDCPIWSASSGPAWPVSDSMTPKPFSREAPLTAARSSGPTRSCWRPRNDGGGQSQGLRQREHVGLRVARLVIRHLFAADPCDLAHPCGSRLEDR